MQKPLAMLHLKNDSENVIKEKLFTEFILKELAWNELPTLDLNDLQEISSLDDIEKSRFSVSSTTFRS